MQVKVIKKLDGIVDRKTGRVFSGRLRVCAYCRVSTDGEEQLNSYESQKKYYNEKINANSDWSFAGIYADEAITGTLDYKRNEFMRMITDAMEGKFDVIITKSISRFARNTLDTLKYVRRLKEKNIAVIFEKENINTLEMSGEFLLTILSSIAQQESESISGNVKLGLKMKMERGELVGFNRCLGYNYDSDKKALTINEKEKEIVKYIFRRYCEGAGSTIIARELTELGYIPPKGGKKWAESTVRGIVRNEKYKGDVLQGKSFTVDPISHRRVANRGEEDKYYLEGSHEAIIPAEVFDKAQSILAKRCGARETGRRKGNYSRKYPFSSRIFCGFCGAVYVRRNLYSSTPYSKRVWQCMEYVKSGKTNCIESKVLREDIIESCFAEAYQLLCKNNKDVIKKFLERIKNVLSDDKIKCAIRKLQEQKTQLKTKLDSLLNLMIDGTIDKEIFKNKKIEINKKIKKADEEIERLECQLQDEKSFDDGFKKISQFFKSKDVNDECFDKDVFEALIYKVIIGEKDKDGNCNPYVIRFIIKNGTEDNFQSRNDGIMNTLLEEDNLILDFESFQKFVSFNKQENGNLRKNLETKVRVKVEMNNGI